MDGQLSSTLGYGLILGLGAVMLGVALVTKRYFVRTTHDYIIANRRISLGFGVGSVISVWTWSMAVLLGSAFSYGYGLSGLLWFVVPNGLAVILMVPFAAYLRKRMPTGYTIIQYVRERFQSRAASAVMLLAVVCFLMSAVMINLFGVVIVTGVIFGLDANAVLLVTIAAITLYSYFGGLWTSTISATLATLFFTIPAGIVVLYALSKAGGASAVFDDVNAVPPAGSKLEVFREDTTSQVGLSLGLGLVAVMFVDQSFWQRVWGMKPTNLGRTFLWAGMWFYPIPLCMGLLGLVAISMGVTPDNLGAFGGGGVAPYVVSHLGLPTFLIALYVLVILVACFSATDGGLVALSGIMSVDVLRRLWPKMRERKLFLLTRATIPVAGVLGGLVVISGVDYVTLVNDIFFLDIALFIPVPLAILWTRYTANAFVVATLASAIAGFYVRENVTVLAGILTILGVSLFVSVVISLLERKEPYDWRRLHSDASRPSTELV